MVSTAVVAVDLEGAEEGVLWCGGCGLAVGGCNCTPAGPGPDMLADPPLACVMVCMGIR